MPLNPDAVGQESEPVETSWTSKDALLYALGVGAGQTDPTGFELEFTTENTKDVRQRVLPTFAVIVGMGSGMGGIDLGTFNPAMLVHGEQSVRLHGEIPPEGRVRTTARVAAMYDKGKAGIVVLESSSNDLGTGDPLFTVRMALFIRGEGDFGGDRGEPAPARVEIPERAPDHEVAYATRTDQALLYRLSGDRNPLHSDPSFAEMAGFPKPILHGLCTYGYTGRALLHALCASDPARFSAMAARFSRPVMPGDELRVQIWEDGAEACFRTVTGDGTVVIDNGAFTRSS